MPVSNSGGITGWFLWVTRLMQRGNCSQSMTGLSLKAAEQTCPSLHSDATTHHNPISEEEFTVWTGYGSSRWTWANLSKWKMYWNPKRHRRVRIRKGKNQAALGERRTSEAGARALSFRLKWEAGQDHRKTNGLGQLKCNLGKVPLGRRTKLVRSSGQSASAPSAGCPCYVVCEPLGCERWPLRFHAQACFISLEEEMVTHSSLLAWRIPWTEEPGGLQSMGSHGVRHDWVTEHSSCVLFCVRKNCWDTKLLVLCDYYLGCEK